MIRPSSRLWLFFLGLFFPFVSWANELLVLNPKGIVAVHERHLFITAVVLMSIVVIPVIILAVVIAVKARASNKKAVYMPDWSSSLMLELVCWSISIAVIAVLAVFAWESAHDLDPYKPIDPQEKPLTIQVIALNWRWLFIYPEQGIATINRIEFPVHRPVQFLITADAPMNAFHIPQLGSQIYAMAGMQTKLNLVANERGEYRGRSTNYSGNGFSQMNFLAIATTDAEFNDWVLKVRHSPLALTDESYHTLVPDSMDSRVVSYGSVANGLFSRVIMKYMMMPEANTAAS